MELWIVRHGQTEGNAQRILQGHQPGKLSRLGIEQAIKTGVPLSSETFEAIYVSDLGRTRETYDNISAAFKNKEILNVIYTSLIREKGGGILEGQHLDVWKKKAIEANIPLRKYKCEGAESWEDVSTRADKFLRVLVDKYVRCKKEEEKSDPMASSSSLKFVKGISVEESKGEKLQSSATMPNTNSGNASKYISQDSIIADAAKGSKPGTIVKMPSRNQSMANVNDNTGQGTTETPGKNMNVQGKKKECFPSLGGCFGEKGPKPVGFTNQKINTNGPGNTITSKPASSTTLAMQRSMSNGEGSKPGVEFDPTLMGKYSKYLMISHGGYIMELLNVVGRRNGIMKPMNGNDSQNCSITVVVVHCKKNADGKCNEGCLNNECIVVKVCKRNDASHLSGMPKE